MPSDKSQPGPKRIRPADAASEAVERVGPRKLSLEPGDAVIVRERVPRLTQSGASEPPLWRYRVLFYKETRDGQVFNSFQHAASAAAQMASSHARRLMYVEDDVPSLLANHRR
jgi:hypothetical protein